MNTYENTLGLIGNTPLIRLNKCVPPDHDFYAKVEFFNPGGSIKDRIALRIIEEAEKRGEISAGGTIVEATSGNTGLGLALVCSLKGYKCILTIPDKMSEEKINTVKAFGAEVVITPSGVAPDDPKSHYSVAKKIAKEQKGFLTNQFHNPDNPKAHYDSTGPEIWEQTNGKIDLFVDGAGTGGTISGVGRYLKEKKPSVKILCADPAGSILYDLFYYKEVRSPPEKYEVEGIGEDMMPENMHFDVIDDFLRVKDKDIFLKCREILAKDGLFAGPSSGAALFAAIEYSKKLKPRSTIVVLFPDGGSKYLSKVFNDDWMKEKGFL